jgi:hypothetical protein
VRQTVPDFRDSKNAFYAIYTSSLATCRNKDFVPAPARKKRVRFGTIQSNGTIVTNFPAIRAERGRLERALAGASTRHRRSDIA